MFLAAGTDDEGKRRTRIRVDEFGAAVRLGESHALEPGAVGGEEMDVDADVVKGRLENDEVECLISNLIYKVSSPLFLSSSYQAS